MNADAAMAKATEMIDEMIAGLMEQAVAMLTAHGATEEELENLRAWYGEQLQQDRADKLAMVAGWLSRRGQTLQ